MSEQSGLRVLLAVDGSVHLEAAVMLAAHLGKLAHRQLQGEALREALLQHVANHNLELQALC